MTNKTELLPCPFCGTDDDTDPSGVLNGDGTRSPECMGCGAIAPTVATWNCRIAAPAEDVRASVEETVPAAFEITRAGQQFYVCSEGGLSPETLKRYLRDVIAQAIGSDAYDCTRVWQAWGVGTMSEDDFVPIVDQEDRLSEIVDACLEEIERLKK